MSGVLKNDEGTKALESGCQTNRPVYCDICAHWSQPVDSKNQTNIGAELWPVVNQMGRVTNLV